MKQVTIEIQGMTCGGCVAAVRNVLGRVAGVTRLEVGVGRATLTFDEAQASAQTLTDAVARAGFVATGVAASDPPDPLAS